MDIHGTVYYETQRPPEVPAFVKNHGLLPQQELQQLLRKAKVGAWLMLSEEETHQHINSKSVNIWAQDTLPGQKKFATLI